MLGQQSLAEFLSLHLDTKKITADNKRRVNAIRKHGIIVNDGNKLTREELVEKRILNQEKYGLTKEQVDAIKLPPPTSVCFYSVKKIMNPKNDLSTIDRIEKLLEFELALKIKLDRIVEEKFRKQCVKND